MRSFKCKAVETVTVIHQDSLSCVDDRQDAVPENSASLVRRNQWIQLRIPIRSLDTSKDIFRPRKSWRPLAIAEHGVPSCVIGMEVSATHKVNFLRVDACSRKTLEVSCIELVEPGRPGSVFVISCAAIDQDRMPLRPNQPGMDA